MPDIFLHGGGDGAETRATTFGRFVQALPEHVPGPLALVIVEGSDDDRSESFHAYSAIVQSAGLNADDLTPVFATPELPLNLALLTEMQPRGVFVCGGVTPLYHAALCTDPSWISYLQDKHIPYFGTSAGAAITAQRAIIGGWRAERGGTERPIMFQGASEGLDPLTTAPGLGLVPCTIDVHASQWGTLLRLLHACDLGLIPAGWAIDEDTMVVIEGQSAQIYGRGHVYQVRRADGATLVTIHTSGQVLPFC